MSYNYLIVLFKNNEKKRIIKKFKTRKRAKSVYNEKIKESKEIIFSREYENGVKSKYELALVKVGGDDKDLYIKDDFGRQNKVVVEDGNFSIVKILPFNVEEQILDYQTKERISVEYMMSKYLSTTGYKLVSKLNNKVVVQNDSIFNLFTLKTSDDASRLIDSLSEHFKSTKKSDCMFVKDHSTTQRKYLYDLLVKEGYPKKYLIKLSTTHPK